MRSRLTLAFVVLILGLGSAAYAARSWTIERTAREQGDAALRREVRMLADTIDARQQLGRPVDAPFLRRYTGSGVAVRLHPQAGPDTVVHGTGFAGSDAAVADSDNLWAVAPVAGGGYVVLSEKGSMLHRIAYRPLSALVLIGGLAALVAGLAGALLAGLLAAPFRQLAVAAAGLGRGRFRLDLPRTRIPEAREIATALQQSARQLEDQLSRERVFAERASHVMRTPLTGLRLELEELVLGDDLPAETVTALDRCVARVDQLDAVTGELVALARQGSLVTRAATPLRDLAAQISRRWVGELATRDRALSVTTAGAVETAYTPGPVEQIMEYLLVDVLHRSRGEVELALEAGSDGALRISVHAERASVRRHRKGKTPVERACAVVLALGGRLAGEGVHPGVEVRLPQR
jgi:hypothetical protein